MQTAIKPTAVYAVFLLPEPNCLSTVWHMIASHNIIQFEKVRSNSSCLYALVIPRMKFSKMKVQSSTNGTEDVPAGTKLLHASIQIVEFHAKMVDI